MQSENSLDSFVSIWDTLRILFSARVFRLYLAHSEDSLSLDCFVRIEVVHCKDSH